jgi:hypothetical protein
MKVLKFNNYSKNLDMAEYFIYCLKNPNISENNESYKSILNKLCNDLKFNFGLITTFGTGIGLMYPIVETLIRKSKLSVELTPENIVLLTITSLSIIYLEESDKIKEDKILCSKCDGSGYTTCDSKNCEGCEICDLEEECESCMGKGYLIKSEIESDIKSLLEELKLRGIGNGI